MAKYEGIFLFENLFSNSLFQGNLTFTPSGDAISGVAITPGLPMADCSLAQKKVLS